MHVVSHSVKMAELILGILILGGLNWHLFCLNSALLPPFSLCKADKIAQLFD